jgi:tetratricopeptide (TPR) repeat protein
MMWQNKNVQAVKAAREAVAIYHATLPENHPDRVMGDLSLGEMLLKQGNADEAAELVAHALVIQKLLYGSDNIVLAGTLDSMAMIEQSRQQWDAAEASAKEALTITERALGVSNVNTAYYYSALADLYIKRKKYRDAEQPARAALSIYQKTATPDNQYLASAEYLLAEVLANTNRYKEADELLRVNIDRWQKAAAPAWRIARSKNLLGQALMNLHEAGEGKQLLKQSYDTLAAPDSGASPEVVAIARQRLRNFGL